MNPPVPDLCPDPAEQLLAVEGLLYIVICTTLKPFRHLLWRSLRCYHDDGDFLSRESAADFLTDLVATDLRHCHIEEDEIREDKIIVKPEKIKSLFTSCKYFIK